LHPLFIPLNHLTAKKAFKAGLYFGAAIAIAGFYWMIPGAERFTGSSIIYGIIVFVISGCFFNLFFELITLCFLLKIDKVAATQLPLMLY
jgi:apolipoprotein N-acyltransferase